jgi:hypothetical protein
MKLRLLKIQTNEESVGALAKSDYFRQFIPFAYKPNAFMKIRQSERVTLSRQVVSTLYAVIIRPCIIQNIKENYKIPRVFKRKKSSQSLHENP